MNKLPDYFQLEQFQISSADVVHMFLHADPEAIHPTVILMPYWQPEIFTQWTDQIRTITPNTLFEMDYQGKQISIIRSGVGAPLAGDTVLALGCTACERIFFAGSVGGLGADMHIGDLLIPEYSVSGDGYCRYLEPGFPAKDSFLDRIAPDEALSAKLAQTLTPLARSAGVGIHTGPVFCIDSILAQFGKLDYISEKLGCIGIEMETAATFKAARLVGIQAAALFSISDVPVRNQTLLSGRSQEEQTHRKEIRRQVLAKALLDAIITE